ncbi:Uracil-DNA glycosylase [Pseudozyma hubeiensis]|nr:Uracil-DNA glycosylase [Pseudozyma hubeiensis]
MTTQATLTKRDANTLASDGAASEPNVKRVKTATSLKEDEFDTSDQEFDDAALLAAAEEAESAASNHASSQPGPPSSSQPTPATASTSSTPRSNLKLATLFPSSSSKTSNPPTSAPTPKLQPPTDLASDPLWLERQTMSPSWFSLLLPEMSKPYFSVTLKNFLSAQDRSGLTTYPPRSLVYSWSRLVPSPQHVRIVVVGQDPYHGPGQACGLSFSVPHGVRVPPSLKNIYKEISDEYSNFKPPSHGCLDGWAKQGVLMLNSCLTVSAGKANSHNGKGWEGLTKHVLKMIADEAGGSEKEAVRGSRIASMFKKVQDKEKDAPESQQKGEEKGEAEGQSKGVVFLIWGAPAAKTLAEAGVTDKNPNILILKSPHPSPLSAHRGFLGNGHFKKANEWLKQRYGPTGMIDWTKL